MTTFPKLTPEEVAHRELVRQRAQLMRLVAINAYVAFRHTVVGNPAPAVARAFERLSRPQVGDVVLETSTLRYWAREAEDTPRDAFPELGVLLRVVDEPCLTQAELDTLHADGEYHTRPGETISDIPTERVFYIRPLDGSQPECRWGNATFITVTDVLHGMV